MAITSTASSTEVPAGLVERITFHNPESGFCVLRVKARGQRDLITVIGNAAMIAAGEFVQASGTWINDRTHGDSEERDTVSKRHCCDSGSTGLSRSTIARRSARLSCRAFVPKNRFRPSTGHRPDRRGGVDHQ